MSTGKWCQASPPSRKKADRGRRPDDSDSGDESAGAHLHRFAWYWPKATRDECDRALAWQKGGAFIVRGSTRPGWLALSVQQRPRGGSPVDDVARHPGQHRRPLR